MEQTLINHTLFISYSLNHPTQTSEKEKGKIHGIFTSEIHEKHEVVFINPGVSCLTCEILLNEFEKFPEVLQ